MLQNKAVALSAWCCEEGSIASILLAKFLLVNATEWHSEISEVYFSGVALRQQEMLKQLSVLFLRDVGVQPLVQPCMEATRPSPPWVLLLVCFAFMLLADCKTKVWSSTYNKKCNAGTRFWSYSDERNMREWGQSLNILLISLHAKAQVRSLRGCWTSQRKRWQTRTGLRVSPLSGKVATCSQITSAKQNCNYNPYWPQRKVSPETFPHL